MEQADHLIPQLKSIHNAGNRPRVRFYEGKEGLVHVYEDTLTSSEEIRAFATIDDMHRALPHYFPAYYKRRAEKDIKIRAIIPKTPLAVERVAHDKEEAREARFYPAGSVLLFPGNQHLR